MVTAILVDLSGTVLFPVGTDYKGKLNDLYRNVRSQSNFEFFNYFIVNEELLSFLRSRPQPLYLYTSDSIQNDPALIAPLSAFKEIFSSKDMGYLKNQKDGYLAIAQNLHVEPREVLFIDNEQENIDAAASAGFQTILYTSNEEIIPKIVEL